MGTTQMMSVPYALYAGSATNATTINGNIVNPQTKIGFTSSTTWTCPIGVTRIKVELWGAGGGAGWHWWNCSTGGAKLGGAGGKGGYNCAYITVVPGNTYSIVIGQGGYLGTPNNSGCNGSYCTTGGNSAILAHGGTIGTSGGSSSFSGILTASGGGGGSSATSNTVGGIAGVDGQVINYTYEAVNYGTRSYIPSNELTPVPSCCASGDEPIRNYPCNPAMVIISASYYNTTCLGENGYCVISY
jgi:hypothetical protein